MQSKSFFHEDVPRRAKLYILSFIFVGTAVLLYSVFYAFIQADFRWIYLACLALSLSFFPVRIPSFRTGIQGVTVTATDIFIFTSILLFGPEVAVTIGAIEGFVVPLTSSFAKRTYKVLFNLTQISVVIFLVGHVFYMVRRSTPPLSPGSLGVPQLFLDLGFSALMYFVLNTLAVATAIALSTGRNIFEVWKKDLLWLSLPTFAGASAAGIIFIYFEELPFFAIAVAGPIVLIIYYAYKLNLERINQAQGHLEQLDHLYHSTIESLAMAIDAKDANTHGHIQRVQTLAMRLAEFCNIRDERELQGLRAASLLHDIGKLAIPDHILNKPSALSKWEEQTIRKHPKVGADILSLVPFPYPVVPYVRYHHEKWDGSGYPDGLKGEEIPLGARILAVADCYDALRSDRPYRPQLSAAMALAHIKSESGKSYDPAIVEALAEHIDELETAMEQPEAGLPSRPDKPKKELVQALQAQERRRIGTTIFHEIASTHKEIQALYDISRALGKSLKVSETLNLLSEKIAKLVPYTSCVVYLVEAGTGKLVPYHAAGKHAEDLQKIELRVGDGITGWVAAHRQHLMNVSPAPDFLVDVGHLRTAFRGCLAMPLTLNNSIVGVMTLYTDQPEGYDQDHLRFMETISDHAATAIRNAIIYEETQENAYTDILTGLPNLRYFNVFMDRELKRADVQGHRMTLLMMDLESFKETNDRFGHTIGNRILREIALVIREQLRNSDTFVRYAGDEFIAVLPGASKEQAQTAIQRIQTTLDEYRVLIDEHTSVQVGVSIGIATFPEDGKDTDMLLAVADQAMYRNKFQRRQQRSEEAGQVVPFKKGFDQTS